MRSTADGSTPLVTSLSFVQANDLSFAVPIIGWTGTTHGLDKQLTTYNNASQIFRSPMYRIGQPFTIKKIRLPLAQAMAANMTLTAKIYADENTTTYTYPTINNTNYPSKKNIVLTTDSSNGPVRGEHSFFLELTWSGSALCTVGLPIEIIVDTLND
jgi:hypothetical protein